MRGYGLLVAACATVVLGSCGGSSGGDGTAAALPSAASATKALEVPQALSQAPFNTAKTLRVPSEFGIRLFARVNGARFMALAPNGDILVSNPGADKITLLRERSGDVPQSFDFATGLETPHDMVFHQLGNTVYLYIAEATRVTRSVYAAGDTHIAGREVVVDNLPGASTPELQGAYTHELKNIALSPDHKLYVSIGSSCNACLADAESDPLRGAIYQYNANGSGRRLFARGVRNAEGLDFLPGTNQLWVSINGRDQIPYPFDNDFDGDGQSDYGKVMQKFVDQNPPDLFTPVRDSGNFGWPFCNPLPNPKMTNLDLARDYELNRDGSKLDCASADHGSKGIRAHSSPLGMSFLGGSNVPAPYRNGAVLALHGCWNCSRLDAGYKVIYFPVDANGNVGAEIDLITGFVTNPDSRLFWGRPVDAIADAKGGILVSDDFAGAIYELYPVAQ